MEIGFCLGSNLGDRIAHVSNAKQDILVYKDTSLLAASPLYETEPVDVQPEYADLDFVNCVLIVESSAEPKTWLKRVATIEKHLGRKRSEDRNAPRNIDIDILFAGDHIIDGHNLTIPHPSWASRRFVLQPLADVRPDLVLPGVNKTVTEMLRKLTRSGKVRRMKEPW